MPSSSPRPIAPFLRLPEELLLQIASAVDDDTSAAFRHLALTHRRLRHIANEALICNGTVSIRGIPRYLELLSDHQTWIRRITRVKLLDTRKKHNRFFPRPAARNACGQFVRDLFAKSKLANQCQFEVSQSKQTYELWVLVLLAIVPAKHLDVAAEFGGFYTAGYRELLVAPEEGRPRWGGHHSQVLLIDGLLEKIRPRIEELTFTKAQVNMCIRGTRPNTWRWTHLKTLSLSGASIPLSGCLCPCASPYTRELIPDDLEVLRIYCDAATCPWNLLNDIHRRKNLLQGNKSRLPDLRQVQVFFRLPATQVADYVVSAKVSSIDLKYWASLLPAAAKRRDIVARWENSEVIETFFAKSDGCSANTSPEDYQRGDIMQAVRRAEKEYRQRRMDVVIRRKR
jgi:hypothetical protein